MKMVEPQIEATYSNDLLERFDRLKRKRQETIKLNKIDAAQDSRRRQLVTNSRAYQHLPNNNAYNSRADSKKDLTDSERAMEYTIEECEKWDKKQERKANHGIHDQVRLAESSYYKEIEKIPIDIEVYKAQKAELQNESHNAQQLSSAIQPLKKVKEEVSQIVKTSKDRKYKKRARDRLSELQDVDGFINEKNKQFNMKLNRQYHGSE